MCLDCYPDRPEPATPPAITYDWAETDPPMTTAWEPITLDERTAKALVELAALRRERTYRY